MNATTTKTATYKGKTYRLEFLGETKYGRRAKLAFLDGSREFWVDASLVTEGGAAGKHRVCCVCGHKEERDSRGYVQAGTRILRSGECQDCYEERKMGY